MKTIENELLQAHEQISEIMADLEVGSISDETITHMLPGLKDVINYLTTLYNEAVLRAREGVVYDGLELTESVRRRFTDEAGALEALRENFPGLYNDCVETHLRTMRELKARLGRIRFNEIFSPFMGVVSSYKFVNSR